MSSDDHLWRAQWIEAANAEHAAWMREYPDEYAAYQAEMRLWDRTLADGLVDDTQMHESALGREEGDGGT